jgi:hypothetical protein
MGGTVLANEMRGELEENTVIHVEQNTCPVIYKYGLSTQKAQKMFNPVHARMPSTRA